MASTTILSDNGVSSGSAGYKITAGNDGVLILQTTTSGGTPNSAVTINNRGDIGVAITPSTWSTGKSIQFPNGAIGTYGTSDLEIGSNYYYSSPNYKYYANGYSDLLALYNNNFQIQSATSGTADATITYTQTLGVGLGTSLALQGATSQSGTGITFPASQNASSNANTLDDYEEGTFTPTYGGSVSNPTVTYDTPSVFGKYTKIGNVVYFELEVRTSAISGGSGDLQIKGLPFTSYSTAVSVNTVFFYEIAFTSGLQYCAQLGGSSTTLVFPGATANSTSATLQVSAVKNVSPSLIRVNGFYYV